MSYFDPYFCQNFAKYIVSTPFRSVSNQRMLLSIPIRNPTSDIRPSDSQHAYLCCHLTNHVRHWRVGRSSTAMMTSSNGNIFRVTGHLCREFTGPRWIPRTKASDAELWCFLWSAPKKRLSKQSWGWWSETHYDIIVMINADSDYALMVSHLSLHQTYPTLGLHLLAAIDHLTCLTSHYTERNAQFHKQDDVTRLRWNLSNMNS